MRRILRGLVLAAVALAALPAAAEEKKAEGEEKKADDKDARREHDDAVKAALEAFKKAVREAKAPAERAVAVKQLSAAERDPRLVPELARLLADADPVCAEVMTALAAYRRDKAAANALLAILPTHAKKPALLERNLEALGAVGLESTIPTVARYAQDETDSVAGAAIRALGWMNGVAAVETVLAVWEDLERNRKKGGDAKAKADKRVAAVAPALKEALTRLTGQRYHFVEEHRAWWNQNRASYKPKEEPNVLCHHLGGPPPGAVQAAAAAVGPVAGAALPGPAAPPTDAPPAAAIPRIEAPLVRAVNLNGLALTCDGHDWEAGVTPPADLAVEGARPFDFKTGPVVPPTDEARARLLRTGLTCTGTLTLTFRNLPDGPSQLCFYIWEDAAAELFEVRVQGVITASNFSTGGPGRWSRLGPWPFTVANGTLVIAFGGGAVNVSGIAIYRMPEPAAAPGAPPEKAPDAKPADEPKPGDAPKPDGEAKPAPENKE
jgi:hypothetical protein